MINSHSVNNMNHMHFMPNYKLNKNKNKNKKLNQIVAIESVIPIKINILDEKIIDNHQYDIITQICIEAIKEKKKDIALYCTEKIIKK